MSTLFPPDTCHPPVHLAPPTAKTVREVALEGLLRECLPYVLHADPLPTDKTRALIERVAREVG